MKQATDKEAQQAEKVIDSAYDDWCSRIGNRRPYARAAFRQGVVWLGQQLEGTLTAGKQGGDGVEGTPAPDTAKPMQGLADWLRAVAETQAADTEQEACLRQWAREVDAARGVKGCQRCGGDGSLPNHPSLIEPTRECPDCKGTGYATGVGVVQTPGMPAKLPAVGVALNMCMQANSEAKLPVPMCWDLALYVKRLEDAVALGVKEDGNA